MKLTLNEIGYLSKIFQKKNAIGLLSNINVEPKGDEQSTLTKKGFFENGKFAPGVEEFLQIISEPERCCRVLVQSGYVFVEKYSYWKDGKLVLAENDAGEVLFSFPEDMKKVVHQFINLFGGSNLKTTTFAQSFSKEELFTFFALVDLCRKDTLEAYLKGTSAAEAFTLEQVAQQIEKPLKTDFVAILRSNYKQVAPFDLRQSLSKLQEKGLIELKDSIQLSQITQLVARNVLLIHSITLAEVFNLKENTLAVLSLVFLNCSVYDILRFQFLEKEVLVSTVSARDEIQELELAMGCPDISPR